MKINELIFWRVQENAKESKRVRKSVKEMGIGPKDIGTFAGLKVRQAGGGTPSIIMETVRK